MKYSVKKLAFGTFIMGSLHLCGLDTQDVKNAASNVALKAREVASSVAQKTGMDMVKARASYIACIAKCAPSGYRADCEKDCLIAAQTERIKELEQKLAEKAKTQAKQEKN